ncbi:MAG: gluconate 2-dehydrogenase subunit 3 family protein [Candidatus Synoicihabitans palmerolidicus]|nr:gluconate 2-dehydrogenase subunit 3 family protein [Candidatus Synoicihabitans palmerolidicus]
MVKLDALSVKRFERSFVELRVGRQARLCDEIAVMPEMNVEEQAKLSDEVREVQQVRRFFRRFRQLTASGFYTTPASMKDIGYIGNVPLAAYPEPPAD